VWDLAAPYSYVNPMEMEAGLSPEQVVCQHLYVEPDGDVLPAQGYNVVLGNLLRDPWEAIWEHPERRRLRGTWCAREQPADGVTSPRGEEVGA
ncbi:MAG TPA: hypothetical protein ENI39_07735, partial [Anaerolineae bacterium]|nr:hypothetical protein [Anaerolineae bacterium]